MRDHLTPLPLKRLGDLEKRKAEELRKLRTEPRRPSYHEHKSKIIGLGEYLRFIRQRIRVLEDFGERGE